MRAFLNDETLTYKDMLSRNNNTAIHAFEKYSKIDD